MINQSRAQAYINNFRRRLAPFLRPGIGLDCSIYPALGGGAVLVFRIGPSVENDDTYHPVYPSLGSALSQIEQSAFGGNLDGFTFVGTNVILEQDRIILIKDDSTQEWSDKAAQKDVASVLTPSRKGEK